MFRLTTQNTTIIENINNGILSSKSAMPQKDLTSDGESSFAMGRQQYIHTDINAKTEPISLGKKWYGASSTRDSTAILQKRAISAIAKGTLNLNGTEMSFAGHNDINTTRDALHRVRHLGCAVPNKCRFKDMNTGAFE
jgi:hypothetical protein